VSEPRRERKVVTVLFADLVGFTARSETLDPEDVEAILRPYHARLREELEQRGGTVEKFVGDAVMAVFGAPTAHEDDPERAVRAALAIRDGIVEDGTLEVRVGVNTGEALVNIDARPDHGEGMVSGDVVNTAARLQSAAPTNGILVGETTHRATAPAIDYREHPAIDAKGKAEPVPVWEVDQARARVGVELRTPTTPLVGRERERELLLGAFERARGERATQLVTIVGVPGIGKSRLVAELYAELEREPDITYWRSGRSLPYGEGAAFWAFAEMVKAQAGILETDDADDAERKLRESVALIVPEADAPWVESRLRPLIGLDSAAGAREESFAAWRRLVESLAEHRPTVVVFEDLHWADDDLLDFVDELVDWLTDVPLLVVATARPELFDRRPGWGGGKLNAVSVSLSPLGDEDTVRLFATLLDRSVLPAETQQTLLARAGGNPLYAEQFARMLEERGEQGDLPETVQGIIAARLDSLPAEEKQLLLDAAVLGKTFWLGALGGGDKAEELLRALQRKEFVRRERRGTVAGETEFAFSHLLVRDVAYGQIPRAERAVKHAHAARWIESLAADRSEDISELLVHHYLAALELSRAAGADVTQLVEPAIAALVDATERALRLSAFGRGEQYATTLLELLPTDDPRTARAMLALGAAEYDLGKGDPIRRGLEAVDGFTAVGDPESAAEAESSVASWAWHLGRRDDAYAASERALQLVADGPPTLARARALTERARLLMLAGRSEEAIDVGRSGLEIARRFDDAALQARALITIGTARDHRGEDGMVDLREGIALADEINAALEVQRGRNNLAEQHLGRGELGEAVKIYTGELKRLERLGLIQGATWISSQCARVAYLTGEWDDAERFSERFLADIEQLEGHYMEPQVRLVQASIALARGKEAEAAELLELSVALARELKDAQTVGSSVAAWALYLLNKGRRDEALQLVDEVIDLTDEQGRALYYTWLIDLGWLLHEFGRTDLPAASRHGVWADAPQAIVRGDFAGAADLLSQAGMRTAEARARLRAAEELTSEGRAPEAQVQLEQALAFYRSVGATAYVRRAEALLPASA
jgi:class 3 adenylate cyclase/tetratricopeptide (TPR) repeat protein